ncbi:hypothetical protein DFQ30_000688 [Apophysomyces sp. BC1015]|nr:hypothetical protein DFQ30_000688 [Apophysomyces sp. BC1015]
MVSNDTLKQVDGVQIQKLLTSNLSAPHTGSRYTFVKSALISETDACEENKGTLSRYRQPPKKPSVGSKRKKQKKGSRKQEESSKRKEDPKRLSYNDPNTGEEIQLPEMTRTTSVWTCCLYSSILAAATTRIPPQQQKAKLQAEVICEVLDKEAWDMPLVRQIALQVTNIALRAAQTLETACRYKVFRTFFRSDRASADMHGSEPTLDDVTKTWR